MVIRQPSHAYPTLWRASGGTMLDTEPGEGRPFCYDFHPSDKLPRLVSTCCGYPNGYFLYLRLFHPMPMSGLYRFMFPSGIGIPPFHRNARFSCVHQCAPQEFQHVSTHDSPRCTNGDPPRSNTHWGLSPSTIAVREILWGSGGLNGDSFERC